MSDIIKTQRSLATKAKYNPTHQFDHLYPPNPYISQDWGTSLDKVEAPLDSFIKAERGAKCECCGSTVNLDLHHLKARRIGGQTVKDNAQLLCRTCHAQTPSFGDHSRLQ